MSSSAFIGIFAFLLQVYVTHQQMMWNEMIPYSEGPMLDYYNNHGVSTFNPINSVYYGTDTNTVPFFVVPDPSIIQMNLAEDTYSPTSSAVSVSTKDNKQPIFQLLDRPMVLKSLKPSQNMKTDITSSSNNLQHFSGMTLPSYNQYYVPELYETQYPEFGLNNVFIETANPSAFFTPGMTYVSQSPFLGQPNMNPFKKPIYIPNKDILSSDDETYKVTLKSASSSNRQSIPSNNINPVRAFKTNFSGDISKCDMICKCRNIFVKPSASPEATTRPYTPQPKIPLPFP